jgi:hypothetical protein
MTTRTLSTVLGDLRDSLGGERTSFDTLLLGLHERGFGVVILIFSLPLCIPVPKPPGLSTLFGIPLLILTIQQALGRHTVWMPQFIRRRHVQTAGLVKILSRAISITEKIENLLRPRLEWVTQGACSNIIGFVGILMAAFIALPLPGSNTIPGIAVTLMAGGVMMRDGLCVIIGAVAGTLWVIGLSTLYFILGREGLNALQTLI